jgi:hypothetical protein
MSDKDSGRRLLNFIESKSISELRNLKAFWSYRKACSLEKRGFYNKALKQYKEYLTRFPDDMDTYRRIALLYYFEGKHQKAYESFSLSKIKDFKIDLFLITNFFDFLAEIDPANISSYKKGLLFSEFFLRFEGLMNKILKLPLAPYGWIEIGMSYDEEYVWEYFCDVLGLSYEIEILGTDLPDGIDIDILRVVEVGELEVLNSISNIKIEKSIKQAIINYHSDLKIISSNNSLKEAY